MKQTIREYLFEGLWGSVGFVEDCGFYSHPRPDSFYMSIKLKRGKTLELNAYFEMAVLRDVKLPFLLFTGCSLSEALLIVKPKYDKRLLL